MRKVEWFMDKCKITNRKQIVGFCYKQSEQPTFNIMNIYVYLTEIHRLKPQLCILTRQITTS